MSIPQSVTEILRDHVTLEVESIDRMYLNLYVPKLQYEGGIASFFRYHRGATFASSALMAPMTNAFVAGLKAYAKTNEVPLVHFAKGQRKDDLAAEYLAQFDQEEGVLFIGVAQEKVSVFRTEKRRNQEVVVHSPPMRNRGVFRQ
jgi:hypothetical protein